jgi:hypothetical protein
MPIPSGGLINKYDLLDPACYSGSGPINDLVGNVDLSTNGSPTYDSTVGSLTWNGLGVGAYSAAGSYANITTTFTFSIWFKLNDVSQTQLLINNGERTSSWSGYSDFITPTTGQLDFGANFVWGGTHSCPNLDANKWYNATYTFSGGTLNFYLDGALISTTTGLGSPIAYGPNAFMAWGGSGVPGFGSPQYQNKASYGVVLFYNTALNSTQVNDIYLTYVDRFLGPVHEYDAADPASYPGSGSALIDIGSSPINLSIQNATFDNINDSFTLQGSLSSYIRSAEPISIGIGANNFSYQMWFQYNGQSNLTGPIDPQLQVGSRGPGDYGGCTLTTVSGQLTIESPGIGTLSTGFSPVAGKWYLITLTVDGSNLNTVYVDGVSIYTGTQSYGSSGTINSIALGPAITNLGDASLSGFGPVQIYDRVLSTTEITNYFNGTFYRFNPGKVYLNASEPASASSPYTTWNDLSNSYDFTMYSPSFTPVSTDPAYYSFPSRDYTTPVSVYGEYNGTPAVTTTNNFTGYFWVRRNADHGSFTQNRLSIFANGREDLISASNGWSYGTYNNPNAANDNVVIERAGFGVIDSGYSFADATWINIAITVDGSNTVTFYQDGEIFGGPGFSFSATTPANGMWISRTAGSFFSWMGDISIIRQYDYALTQAQIQELYNYDYETYITPTPPPPPPVTGLVGGRTFGQGFAG